jgi:hypothetical protein
MKALSSRFDMATGFDGCDTEWSITSTVDDAPDWMLVLTSMA